jgi:hypothetical protein
LQLENPLFLVTADVKDLYPSIPIEEGIDALRTVLRNSMQWDEEKINFITNLAEFVLRNNIFQFQNKLYIQIFGTAMGTPFAPSYATIYLHVIEVEIWHNFKTNIPEADHPLLIKRFIDDLFGMFKTEYGLHKYIELYNAARPSIKLLITAFGNSVDILDLTIFKGRRYETTGILDIKLFQKQMNKYQYIPPDSFHTRSTIKGFISGEIRRARLCCSNDDDFISAKSQLYRRLKDRNYTDAYLQPLFETTYDRNQLITPLERVSTTKNNNPTTFIIQHSPRFTHEQLKNVIKFPEELEDHPHFHNIFNGFQPIICYQRSNNIHDLLNK